MKLSNVKTEQITRDMKVLTDYGEILSKSELKDKLLSCFGNLYSDRDCVFGNYNGTDYCIYFKNISYLGIPHAHFKKRIQIGDNFKDIYNENKRRNIKTLLFGIYCYKDTTIFVDFDILGYINGKSHNSSAHVYTNDLKNALLFGTFQKTDIRGNIITAFTPGFIDEFMLYKFKGDTNLNHGFVRIFDDFFTGIKKNWYGIDCYKEMEQADFNNKYQAEWPGFYLEYSLGKYIKENNVEKDIRYVQNKKKEEIDLDLYFPKLQCYGDLKAHSNNSSGIQGNDWDTVMSVLETSSIYYIVCHHDTEMDKDYDNVVTVFWNKRLKKENLLSYSQRMKHSVRLTKFSILEIDKYNKKYLDVFHQGKNSNGDARESKIMIKDKNLDNFLIHQAKF